MNNLPDVTFGYQESFQELTISFLSAPNKTKPVLQTKSFVIFSYANWEAKLSCLFHCYMVELKTSLVFFGFKGRELSLKGQGLVCVCIY